MPPVTLGNSILNGTTNMIYWDVLCLAEQLLGVDLYEDPTDIDEYVANFLRELALNGA